MTNQAILNTQRAPQIQVPCSCQGNIEECELCRGVGTITRPSCRRCGGTGKEAGSKCLDCRGDGWRDVELL